MSKTRSTPFFGGSPEGGAGGHLPVAAGGHLSVAVAYPRELSVAGWAARHREDGVPGRWPYGLDRLARSDTSVTVLDLVPDDRAHRAWARVARRRPVDADVVLTWDENAAGRLGRQWRAERHASGVVWLTDDVDGALRAAAGGDAAGVCGDLGAQRRPAGAPARAARTRTPGARGAVRDRHDLLPARALPRPSPGVQRRQRPASRHRDA